MIYDALYWSPPNGSLVEIVLVEWAPLVFSLIVGGVLANILFPRWQAKIQRAKDLAQRRRELCEEVIQAFESYISNLSRLYSFSFSTTVEQKSEPQGIPDNDNAFSRQQEYVRNRDESKDRLYTAFALSALYFPSSVTSEIEQFKVWNKGWAPELSENKFDLKPLREKEKRIVNLLRKRLSKF